jgi:DNA polymerase-3 subunit delta
MQYFQFLEHLKRSSFSPVYLFSGEEGFLKEEALVKLEKALFSERGVAEKDVFEGEVSALTLEERLKTLSLLGKPGLVVIKKTQKLSENCRKILLQYIKGRSFPNFLVVFLDKEENRKKWDVPPFFVEFKKFYEGDCLNWLITCAGNNKKTLPGDAARALLARMGPDLALLAQGLERVINYIGPKRVIELKDVDEILCDEKKDAIFDLTDALASQNLPDCIGILNKLFLSLTPPQQIISLLSWQVRQLYTLKRGGELKTAPFFLKRLRAQTQRFKEEQLKECLRGLRKVDADIKSGLRGPKLSLELFFFKFLKPGEAKI